VNPQDGKPRLTGSREVTDADIDECSRLTADFGAHHVHGRGGRRMAQGALTLTAVPLLWEPGVHVRELALAFLAPVYSGETVTATLEITGREDAADAAVGAAAAAAVDVDAAGADAAAPLPQVDLHFQLAVVNDEQSVVITGTGVARLTRELADARLG
jgi:3-hydroxybutyryl-CoA dehydratase